MSVKTEDASKKSLKKQKSDADVVAKQGKEKSDKVKKSDKKSSKSKKEVVKDVVLERKEDEIETEASPLDSDNESISMEKSKKKKDKKDRKDKEKLSKKKKSKTKNDSDNDDEQELNKSKVSKKHVLSDSEKETDSDNNQKPAKQFKSGKSDKQNVVFVSSIAYSTSEDELSDFFADCGEIEKIRWIQSDHGRALVFFSSEEAVQSAIEKSGQQGPGGRYVSVSEHHFNDWYDPNAVAVRIDNSYEETLKSAYESVGNIISVTFHGDNALVCFGNEEEADAAVAKGRVSVGDQEVDARLATSKYHYGIEKPNNFHEDRGRGFNSNYNNRRGSNFGGGRGGGFNNQGRNNFSRGRGGGGNFRGGFRGGRN